MKVLYATSECWPFAKTGGLGDVAYALPKALKKEGVDVRVIMPKYSTIPNYLKSQLKEVAVFSVNVGWRKQYCGLLEMELDGVKFYFIDNEFYFKREGEYAYLYGYGDDAERFTFFSTREKSQRKNSEHQGRAIHHRADGSYPQRRQYRLPQQIPGSGPVLN